MLNKAFSEKGVQMLSTIFFFKILNEMSFLETECFFLPNNYLEDHLWSINSIYGTRSSKICETNSMKSIQTTLPTV